MMARDDTQCSRVYEVQALAGFLSVVVPVLNGSGTIRQCIESLLAQDYPRDSYEIIVVDNNSTDETDTIVRQYPVTLLYERRIQTSYAARNRGILHARGSIVAFTDADCVADPRWLSQLVKPFADPAVAAVGGKVLAASPTSDVERFICSLGLFSNHQADARFLPLILTGNAGYRRQCLLRVGMFNARLFTAADVDLSWRIQLATNSRVAYAPQAIVHHKHRSTVKGMARQFRREGYGQILLDTMYRNQDGYQQTPRRQLAQMGRQSVAMATYGRSLAYRCACRLIGRVDRQQTLAPLFHLVAEGSNLFGKLFGLWDTRLFCVNPADRTPLRRWRG